MASAPAASAKPTSAEAVEAAARERMAVAQNRVRQAAAEDREVKAAGAPAVARKPDGRKHRRPSHPSGLPVSGYHGVVRKSSFCYQAKARAAAAAVRHASTAFRLTARPPARPQMCHHSKLVFIGSFTTAEAAARAHDKVVQARSARLLRSSPSVGRLLQNALLFTPARPPSTRAPPTS